VGVFKPLADTTPADFDYVFNINTRGVFYVLSESARRVQDGGHIVVISSVVTSVNLPGTSVYSASKAAIETLAVVLSKELGPRKVSVNSVNPASPTPTCWSRACARSPPVRPPSVRMRSRWDCTLAGRLGTVDDIANVVYFLTSAENTWVTGQVIIANGGRSK
jgi:3-oxoacyl-[acyl-carrier protein] reductase